MSAEVVIGVDGGGTRTRAMMATRAGQVLAYAETGPASPKHTANGETNVRHAINEVLAQAPCPITDVVALAAGLSGLDSPPDQQWAERWTTVPPLTCPRVDVNDAVVAHVGAFRSHPGILAVAGTGSNVLAVTEGGKHVRNGDFAHYAPAAAVHLAIDSVLRILAGDADGADQAFVEHVLDYWQVANIGALRAQGRTGFVADRLERLARLSAMAPLVTDAAARGSPLAHGL
jgi:glucosamine kinase